MILCLDVGNTQIHGGLFENDELIFQFRKSTTKNSSSDEIGLFLRQILRENNYDLKSISDISICSVVPDANYSLRNGCVKYFDINPFFLQPGVKTGIKIKYYNPAEVGADRIANAIAAVNQFPNKNLIIVDFGTATTFCVISKEKDYLGGAIVPGIRTSMEALEARTAKLPKVEIIPVEKVVGKSTVESIQAGLYFGQIGTVKEIKKRIIDSAFSEDKPLVIGTGGFSHLFVDDKIFDVLIPNLVLDGLNILVKMNKEK
ncbi:MAG: type III pantothenate kinase [Ignavibacteriales bacterium]|nr:type III pantothenate kinase [Ignavibacteriales bacterium]